MAVYLSPILFNFEGDYLEVVFYIHSWSLFLTTHVALRIMYLLSIIVRASWSWITRNQDYDCVDGNGDAESTATKLICILSFHTPIIFVTILDHVQ